MLTFENHRRIEGADYTDDAVWGAPWLFRASFSEAESTEKES